MPIADHNSFCPIIEGIGEVTFGYIRQLEDDDQKLFFLKKRLEGFLIQQIDPVSERSQFFSPFPLTVLTCVAVETLGRVTQPVTKLEKSGHKKTEISKLVSVPIYGELDKKLTRPLPQGFKKSMQELWPKDKNIKSIKSYAELFHSYLRTSFMHGYRAKNVYLNANLEEGWVAENGSLTINPYWFWKEYKRVFEESFEKIFDKKEKNNPYRINALAYLHRLIHE
ncbi:hypothetical protein [Haliscomenobacter sp.]|uniref:hypothetical protein n=1 Tax=Haliscomenobacter sp. TaxID=2717303 RepID=UPI003BAC2873